MAPLRSSGEAGAKIAKKKHTTRQQSMPLVIARAADMLSRRMRNDAGPVEAPAKFRQIEKHRMEVEREKRERDQLERQYSLTRINELQNQLKAYSDRIAQGEVFNAQQQEEIQGLQRLFNNNNNIQRENARVEQRVAEKSKRLSQMSNRKLDQLGYLLTEYEKRLAAGEALISEQEEKIKSLRKAVSDELKTAYTRENYILDLESDNEVHKEYGEALRERERKITSELAYMTQRVTLLEHDLDNMIEKAFITDNRYYNMFCEQIYEWKKLRDLILRSEPKKTFWETVHAYGNFMEKTLMLSDEATRISNDLILKTEFLWSQQLVEQVRNEQGGYSSFKKALHFQPLSVSELYHLPRNEAESDSDSDTDYSDNDHESDLQSFHSPDSSPFSQTAEFTSVDNFVEQRLNKRVSQLGYLVDTDDEDSGYVTDVTSLFGPRSFQCSRGLFNNQLADDNSLQGFQSREDLSEETIISRGGEAVAIATTAPRKRLKKNPGPHTRSSFQNVEAPKLSMGKKRTTAPDKSYTYPDVGVKSSLVRQYQRHGQQKEGRQTRKQFPDRVAKKERVRSSHSKLNRLVGRRLSAGSSIASLVSDDGIPRITSDQTLVKSTQTSPSISTACPITAGDVTDNYSLAEWIWIYCKQRPRALIRPLVGIGICVAAMYLIRDWRLYQRIAAANTRPDRMMDRMRQAQMNFQTMDPYANGEWKRWLDADRVALQ